MPETPKRDAVSKLVSGPRIVTDTREQEGHVYAFEGFNTISRMLDAGDYSLDGHESRVAVERKTKSDAYGCVGGERDRFERALERLAKVEFPALVIEADLLDFACPPPYTKIDAGRAVGSLVSWSVQHRLPVWFCHGRDEAERITLRILASYLKHLSGGAR